jgi:serralysin
MTVGAEATRSSGNAYIDGVLGYTAWSGRTLSYSFPASGSYYGPSYASHENKTGFGALNARQQSAVRTLLDEVASLTNLSFSELTESSSAHATLRFAMSDGPGTAWSYFPSSSAQAGDVWFNKSSGDYDKPVKGNYAYVSILHETSHALGLKHPHEAGMPSNRDAMEYTVVSYRSYVGASAEDGYSNEAWGYAQSLMMYDIAALQHMYGADFTTNGGNTVYSWSPTTGQAYINGVGQGAPGGNRVFETVWDGGGADTYDFSNYATNLSIDLRPGQSSLLSKAQRANLGDGHYAQGNVYNALQYKGDARSLIENANGGSGHDAMTGNAVANKLTGGNGNDKLYGLQGDDTLKGGGGNDWLLGSTGDDTLWGGAGADTFVFNSALNARTNVDTIADFSSRDDTIRIDNNVFKALTDAGTLARSAFEVGSAADDPRDRIIYDKDTGALFYDADGSGAQAAVKFAQIGAGLPLSNADVIIF